MKNLILLTLALFVCFHANAQDYQKEANACFEKGDYECAKRNYNLFQIWNGNDMSAEIKKADECQRSLILADNYFKEEEYEKARDRYRDVLERNPKDPHAKKQFEACEERLAPVETSLTVSVKELSFQASGGTEAIAVATNADGYEVVTLPGWCTLASKGADGFSIRCDVWEGASPRNGTFLVKANDLSEQITVRQAEAPKKETVSAPEQPARTEQAPATRTNTVAPATRTNTATRTSKPDATFRKNVFGADVGLGSRNLKTDGQGTYQLGTTLDLGLRYTFHFSPHFGWDAANLKLQAVMDKDGKESIIQFMTGIRAYTPTFAKNMKGYASLKAGYGKLLKLDEAGFAYELEIGAYLSKIISLGFAYNAQSLQGKFSEQSGNFNSAYAGLRLGVSF